MPHDFALPNHTPGRVHTAGGRAASRGYEDNPIPAASTTHLPSGGRTANNNKVNAVRQKNSRSQHAARVPTAVLPP